MQRVFKKLFFFVFSLCLSAFVAEFKRGDNMKFIFNKTNIILLVIAFITTIVGYIIMGTGDNTISPILLIIAYVILFPASIIVGTKKKEED